MAVLTTLDLVVVEPVSLDIEEHGPYQINPVSFADNPLFVNDGLFDLNLINKILSVSPYLQRKVSDPGYPYFYSGIQNPSYSNRLNLDGLLYLSGIEIYSNGNSSLRIMNTSPNLYAASINSPLPMMLSGDGTSEQLLVLHRAKSGHGECLANISFLGTNNSDDTITLGKIEYNTVERDLGAQKSELMLYTVIDEEFINRLSLNVDGSISIPTYINGAINNKAAYNVFLTTNGKLTTGNEFDYDIPAPKFEIVQRLDHTWTIHVWYDGNNEFWTYNGGNILVMRQTYEHNRKGGNWIKKKKWANPGPITESNIMLAVSPTTSIGFPEEWKRFQKLDTGFDPALWCYTLEPLNKSILSQSDITNIAYDDVFVWGHIGKHNLRRDFARKQVQLRLAFQVTKTVNNETKLIRGPLSAPFYIKIVNHRGKARVTMNYNSSTA